MAESSSLFQYVAVDARGRRVKGAVTAADDHGAFEQLKRNGLSPISLRPGAAGSVPSPKSGRTLGERDLAALLSDLAALTKAGADLRTSFAIVSSRSDGHGVRDAARALSSDIGGGASLENAFAKHLPARFDFVAALIAAGETGGDLAAGFERAAEMLSARLKLRDQLVSAVSYPAFVFVSTLGAIAVILFLVLPSLAPLVEESNGPPPVLLASMISVSTFFKTNAVVLLVVLVMSLATIALAARAGVLRGLIETLLLDGPAKRTMGGLVYGGFAVALGSMLAGGAPMSEALRLAGRSVGNLRARSRLEPVGIAVRQGASLSSALDKVASFPNAIGRLAVVGEAAGSLGEMIARAGRLEEAAAMRRLEAAGKVLGPALIVLLGGVIGLLMAGLLTGVSQLGQSALS